MEKMGSTVVPIKTGSSQNEEPHILETRGSNAMDADYNSVVWIKEEAGYEEESLDERDADDDLNSSKVKNRQEKRIRKGIKPHSSSYVKEDSRNTKVREASSATSDNELSLYMKEEPSFKEETVHDWDIELEEVLHSAVTNAELKLTDKGTGCSNGNMENQKAYRRFWTEFIQLYKDHPCLWKVKSKEYSDRWKKTMAYGVLVQKLKEIDESANRETVTKKINSMRSSFRKELKKVASSRKSGAKGSNVYQPNLWYYNLLLFLQDQETPQELSLSVSEELEDFSDTIMCTNDVDTEDQDECQSTSSQRSSVMPTRSCRPSRLRKRRHSDTSDDALALIGDYLQSSCLEDECSIIGKNIAAKLRRLSEEQRIISERLINEVLFRGRLNKLNINTGIV